MIEEYKFGTIKISGKNYFRDVRINWNGEVFDWQRKESHTIDLKDIENALFYNPDLVIIGTGFYGEAEVTEELKQFFQSKEIDLLVDDTDSASKIFNEKIKTFKKNDFPKVIGFFHLTC